MKETKAQRESSLSSQPDNCGLLKVTCEQEDSQVPPEHSENKVFTFKCPKCNGNTLHEITTGQWSTLIIAGITPDGEVICGENKIDGCGDNWFHCADCTYVLKDKAGCQLSNEEELLEWMKENHG